MVIRFNKSGELIKIGYAHDREGDYILTKDIRIVKEFHSLYYEEFPIDLIYIKVEGNIKTYEYGDTVKHHMFGFPCCKGNCKFYF